MDWFVKFSHFILQGCSVLRVAKENTTTEPLIHLRGSTASWKIRNSLVIRSGVIRAQSLADMK